MSKAEIARPKGFYERKKAWLHYDKDVDRLNQDIVAHNKGVIIICSKCSKVDVHPIYHASKCNPGEEALRAEAQDYLWK